MNKEINSIRILVIMAALMWGLASGAWAQLANSDVEIEVKPSASAGDVNASVNATTREVTLTVTPASGYFIKTSDFVVEKLVNPDRANAPKRRTPGLSDAIKGKMYSGSGRTEEDIINSVAYPNSAQYAFTIPADYDGAYVTATFHLSTEDNIIRITASTNLGSTPDMTKHYILVEDVSASVVANLYSSTSFTGTFEGEAKEDGSFPTISGLSHALFQTVNGGTVKNIVLDNVTIGGSTSFTVESESKTATGAIANIATGSSRIYNCGIQATNSTVKTDEDGYTHITACSSTVSANSDYVGGLVGYLDVTSRVINCYSYANVSGGSYVGGIVGYNKIATTATNLKTMVMNCMFYGEVSGTSIAPIYNGEIITNVGSNIGVSNFNYFRLESSYIQNTGITKVYNCALGAETRFLQRFEFFRHLQNSHRELAAWWASTTTTPSPNVTKGEMAKWVLLPSQIGSSTPYPVLAKPDYYPSVVNIDAENASYASERNKGGNMGTLAVNIRMGSGGAVFGAPTGATITKPYLTLNITDKDPEHFNFNYYKVQLPYYNDVGTKNYTGNRVVTGWKIVSISGGTPGTYTESDSWGGYNFADRNCTNKDLYSSSHRVFNQGAYWDVPEGVTAITIEPYWAKAAYLADANADVVYNENMGTSYQVSNVGGGTIYTNGNSYSIAGNSQKVYTSLGNAVTGLGITGTPTVNDYAVVLVGNYHIVVGLNNAVQNSNPYTVTSVDLDGDDEPDYSLMLRNNGRNPWHPVKWDFINIAGLGMAQKSTGASASGSYNLGIVVPTNWFETTNTSLFRVTQFEYERSQNHTTSAPYILQGGVMEQWVTGQQNSSPNHIKYFLVGGNVWFKEFHRGVHQDNTASSNHPPVSVTGGDFEEFYLTGLYRGDVTSYGDNAECYINGGRFGIVAGAAMEGIGKTKGADNTGNVTWLIQNADIKEFYGGGINADSLRRVEGNIATTIIGGKIDLFCGGPKFGDMNKGKTVVTNATGCEFGTFFGAGFGGSSYSRRAPSNIAQMINMPGKTNDSKSYNTWNAWVTAEYNQASSAPKFPGISTQFSYQFIPNSGNENNVGRLFVEHVLFSLATTRNVTSTLTNCTITGNFYGGGSLGKVDGPVTSTLTDCTIMGNVFGAGYSASLPTVEVDSIGFRVEPYYYSDLGTYRTGVKGKTTTYKWAHGNAIGINKTDSILYTTEDLNGLGSVTGNATLTITGTTTVGGNVYGGGEESGVGGNTQVFVNNGTIGTGTAGTGNVFGAGKGLDTDYDAALVKGNSTITMTGGTVKGSIFGGGELSSVGTFTRADNTYHTSHPTVEVGTIRDCTDGTGTTTVTISGGTVGNSGEYTYNSNSRLSHTHGGNVFAGGKGVLKKSDNSYLSNWIHFARVKNTVLNVSGENTRIMSSIYGGGEIGSVGYLNESGALVEGCGTAVTVSDGIIIGTEIKDGEDTEYTFGSVFGGGYGSDLETTTTGQTDPNAPKLYAGRIYGNTSVTMSGGAVKASIYGGGELASVSGNATVTVSGGTIGIPKDLTRNKQFGGATMGNVYGGGSGNKNIVRAGQIYGNTTVSISEADPTNTPTLIYHNVYGGGAYGSVGTFEYHYTKEAVGYEGIEKVDGIVNCAANTGRATITITGGTFGVDGKENGMIFGSSRGDIGAPGSRDDLVAWVNHTSVTIGTSGSETGPTIKGSVYGSGENGHVLHNTAVTIHSGKIGIDDPNESNGGATYPYRGNVYGAGCGTDKYYSDTTGVANPYDGNGDSYNPMAGIVEGTTTVTIDGGYVVHHVYGAGAMGSVGNDTVPASGKTTINISGGRIGYDGNKNGNVFGAARGEYGISTDLSKNLANVRETEVNIDKHPSDAAKDPVIWGSVFGGGESGVVKESVTVNMKGGLIKKDIYGGGALADTQTSNWDATKNANKGGWATGKTSASAKTTVNLTGGTVTEEVFGGGLGESGTELNPAGKPAYVYGDVLVELNKDVADDAKGCIVGEVFGCNNLNGTPMGDVKVHIYKTQHKDATRITNAAASGETPAIEDAKVKGRYDVLAVYGGGNQSAYEPANPNTNKTEVIIDGCELTSIRQVYGGGDAACTPSTNVTVNGTFEIMELFGGGNGLDAIQINGVTMPNPGANVGYKNYSVYYKDDEGAWQVKDSAAFDTKEERMAASDIVYGTGKASVNIYGGTIHRVFGGSNTKGNVRQTAVTLLDESSGCPFRVDEAYGGGKSAEMDAEAQLLMACIPGLQAVYGGAEAADVHGNVTLNITNGTFDRVFGGNNLSGTIGGAITINVEEIGCRPVIIGELYGGGNQAAYSVYGYKEVTVGNETVWKPRESATDSGTGPANPYADPQVNVMSFTSIGQIFGGGYGNGATMVGNPTVNINEVYGKYYNDDDESENPSSVVGEDAETPNHYPIPSHAAGKMGAIYNVFGGGNAAKVIGNTTVNIGTLSDVYLVKQVSVGDDVSSYYTRNNDGSYTAATSTAADGTTYYEKVTVLGADIRGNVYGGGNNAEVTGNTNVNIGQRISE